MDILWTLRVDLACGPCVDLAWALCGPWSAKRHLKVIVWPAQGPAVFIRDPHEALARSACDEAWNELANMLNERIPVFSGRASVFMLVDLRWTLGGS